MVRSFIINSKLFSARLSFLSLQMTVVLFEHLAYEMQITYQLLSKIICIILLERRNFVVTVVQGQSEIRYNKSKTCFSAR